MKRILVVDDQNGIRLLLAEVFRREGHETVLAKNGFEAVERFHETSPDCVLLDMKMPGMDGIEVLKEIKAVSPSTPVLMMTAYGEQEQIDTAKELGATDYFTKPFDIHELRAAVAGILG
ncbi:response regulator [Edaphobacillus lindanitolerans]|uniref:Two-component system, response regulator, stage 0 sporulation protein F n=1 Tax=Edaphobacillus lindanitolerans TaxID=550447 RepID=A0A1U7PLT9_9BACI|nr:response regulator [Edaphobacillus lindanitolerans]SIT69736.1 two-component system, response regulator, stage 0 sporulation protein F [Edaphobacillus lindanitolerans]